METLSGSLTVFSRTDALILYIPLVTTNLDIMNDYRIINFKCIILYLDYMITYGISWDVFLLGYLSQERNEYENFQNFCCNDGNLRAYDWMWKAN